MVYQLPPGMSVGNAGINGNPMVPAGTNGSKGGAVAPQPMQNTAHAGGAPGKGGQIVGFHGPDQAPPPPMAGGAGKGGAG